MPQLSLCIPTYNRARSLERALERLFADPDFDPAKIEVVVSDNASTDDTAAVAARFPGVRYFRNAENIGANPNFTVLFGHARGRYIRLMNDTVRFRPGMLKKMLDRIECASGETNLAFFQARKPSERTLNGKDDFLGAVSFFVTWIANTGMWRADFEAMEDKNRFVATLLHQVDWMLRVAGNGRTTRLVFDRFFEVEDQLQKGSYGVFNTFVTQYLSILKAHRVGRLAFAREKFRLFTRFLAKRLFAANAHSVDMSHRGIVYRRYWYEPYFLPWLALGALWGGTKRLLGKR